MQKHWIFIGAIHAAVAVALGAFGAHGLVDFLAELHLEDQELVTKRLGDWKTAAQYQICLLYTSPSPRDQRGSRMPSSA